MFNRVGLLGVAKINSTGEIIGQEPMPFTAEKQLELIEFLTTIDLYGWVKIHQFSDGEFVTAIEIADPGYTLDKAYGDTMGEAIAALINKRWEYLKEGQKQKVKEILKCPI